jgi:hypothetical protein
MLINIISALKDISTLVLLWIGAKVAWEGLSVWKTQIRGNTEYDLARRTLKAVYKVRDAVESVRYPFISNAEMNNAQSELVSRHIPESGDPPPKPTRADLMKAVYNVRWREVKEAGLKLHDEYVEVEAVWGKEAKTLLLAVQKSVVRLSLALEQYLEDEKLNKEDSIAIRAVVFNTSGEVPDEFSKNLNEKIENIEEFLKPMLEIKGNDKKITQSKKKIAVK